MPQPNDLSRSLVALDQNSTIIAVIEMSQSSWLVAGMLPGIERQPRKKLEPSPERLLALLHRWRGEAVRAGRTITRIALAFEAGRDGSLRRPRFRWTMLKSALAASVNRTIASVSGWRDSSSKEHQGALPGVKYTSSAEFCTLWAAHAIGRVLRAGVTSIAVPGGKWFTDVTVREAVEGGLLEGPRMVVAGRALSNYGGIFDPDPYPAYEGTPNDAAGVLCNTRDEFIRETLQAVQARGRPDQDRRFHLGRCADSCR